MGYIVYIDRLFLLHLTANSMLLLLTARILGNTVTFRRILGWAAIGASLYCMVFLMPLFGKNGKLLLFSLTSLLVLWRALRLTGFKALGRAAAVFFAVSCLAAGGLQLCLRFTGRPVGKGYDTWQIAAAMTGVLAGCLILLRKERRRKRKILLQAVMEDGDQKIPVTALVDSGNSLFDPIGGKPVCVVERSALEGRISLDKPERFRLIPYHSLGKEHGLMQAVEIDRLKIRKEEQDLIVEKAVLGLYQGKVSEGGSYQMILHPALVRDWEEQT